jgi:hypothetical protein
MAHGNGRLTMLGAAGALRHVGTDKLMAGHLQSVGLDRLDALRQAPNANTGLQI